MLAIIVIVIYFALCFFLASQFSEVAAAKGYQDKKYYWICFWLGLPGWLLVIALPNRENNVPVISDELPDL